MVKNTQYYQRLNFKEEFMETLNLFFEIAQCDKRITSKIEERDKSKGIKSACIRFAIQQYVEANKGRYLEAQQKKAGEKNEQSA